MFKRIISITIGGLALVSLATASGAAVTFDSGTGTGFVGKGDVQLAFGWNNAQFQTSHSGVTFEYESEETTVTEVSWECTNSNNEKIQERARTTVTQSSISGIVSGAARERNQITGYNLNGWSSKTVTSSSSTDGPAVNSCPSGPWSLSSEAGAPEVVSNVATGGLYATHNGIKVLIG